MYWKKEIYDTIVDVVKQDECPEYYIEATEEEYIDFKENTGPILVPDIYD